MVNVNKNVNIFSVNSNHHRTSGTRTYTRAMGQHSIFSQAGWHGAARSFNAYDTHTVNLNRYSRMREGLNNRWDNYEHYHHGPQGPQEQNPSLLETLMVAIPLGKLIFDFGKDIAKTFNIGGGKKTSKSNPTDKGNGVDPSGGTPPSKSGGLGNVQSFLDISNLKTQNLNSLKNFNIDYQNASVETSVSTALSEASDGLALIGEYDLNTSLLHLDEIKIDAGNPDFKTALESIDKDIEDVNTYVNTNIADASSKLGSKITALEQLISDAKLSSEKDGSDNSTLIAEYEKQLADAKKAQDTLTRISETCKDNIDQLKAKRIKMQNAQKTHNQILDKEYNMAKEQDEKLGKINAEIERLKSEIAKLSTPKVGSKEQKKLDDLNVKLTAANNEAIALLQSLKSAPTPIKNSGGTEYEFKNFTNSQPAGGGS